MNVKHQFEGPQGNIVRFWLELNVNGRTAQSRGVVIELANAPLPEMRRAAREMAETAQQRINIEAPAPKVADAALKTILSEINR